MDSEPIGISTRNGIDPDLLVHVFDHRAATVRLFMTLAIIVSMRSRRAVKLAIFSSLAFASNCNSWMAAADPPRSRQHSHGIEFISWLLEHVYHRGALQLIRRVHKRRTLPAVAHNLARLQGGHDDGGPRHLT